MSSLSTNLNNEQPTKVRHHVAIMGFLASLVNYADRILISVAAPLILADLSIFLLISRMKFISGKIATNISICAFGIYLVHIMS